MQHYAIDHTLTFMHSLLIHLMVVIYTYNSDNPPEQNSEAAAGGVLKVLQISQEYTRVGASFLQGCKPSGLQRY